MRRMMSVVMAMTVGVLTGTMVQRGAADTVAGGPFINPDSGHQYFLLQLATWYDAEAFATNLGGHLTTIRGASENQWLLETLLSSTDDTIMRVYTGLNDVEREGQWAWAGGEPFSYSNWGAGEPNNCCGGEDFGLLILRTAGGALQPGEWNDSSGRTLYNAIAELASPIHPPALSRRHVDDDCGPGCLTFDVSGIFGSDGYALDLPHDLTINGSNVTLDIFAHSPGGTPDEAITPFSTSAFFGPLNNGLYRDTINLYVDGELVDTLTGSFRVPIPEPGTVMMLVVGGAMLMRRRG